MALDKIKDYFKSDGQNLSFFEALLFVIFAIAMYALDILTQWNGYPIGALQWNVLTNALRVFSILLVPILLYFFVVKPNAGKPEARQELLTGIGLHFIWVLIGIIGLSNGVTIVHLTFAIVFYYVLRKAVREDLVSFNAAIIIITLMDFFGFALLKNLSGFNALQFNRLMIPLWLFYTIGFAIKHNGHQLFTILLFIIIGLYVVIAFDGVSLIAQNTDKLDKSIISQFYQSLQGGIKFWTQDIWQDLYQQTFNQSYMYGGQQEQTENPQGVYIKQLEQGDMTYREGDPVRVWAQIEARTLKEPIDMKVNCQAVPDDEDLKPIDGIVDEDARSKELELTVYTATERSIPCFFSEESTNLMKAGTYEIVFNATFNFAAESELKVYLMDRDRMIRDYGLLRDKGLEPSKEALLMELYKITDTAPESLYTSGPIGLGIGTDKVPWDIGQANNPRPLFGVSVQNLWTDGGEIQSLDTLQFKIPEEIELQTKSCDVKTNFVGSEKGYKIYAIAPEKPIGSIEDFRSFRCLLVVNHAALDNTPLTVRFLKASVKYTYLLQQSVPIEIEEIPKTDEQAALESRTKVCCHIITGSSSAAKETYEWTADDTSCLSKKSSYTTADVVINSLCETGKKCCEVREEGPSTKYYWVDTEEECTTLGKNSRGSTLLATEDNHLCN